MIFHSAMPVSYKAESSLSFFNVYLSTDRAATCHLIWRLIIIHQQNENPLLLEQGSFYFLLW